MNRYANYMIIPELRLLLECCKGKATVEDAVQMKKEESADMSYNPDYDIIVDIQEFETDINSETTGTVQRFTDFLREIGLRGKIAFLTSEPHQVVVSLIIKEFFSKNDNVRIEVFSTIEAAAGFLGFPVEKNDLIKSKILQLRKKIV